MSTQDIGLGQTTGQTVSQNVRRYRQFARLTLEQLEELLGEVGHPIPKLTLGRIENGKRRVDVDDLMALAVVLRVHPNALLLPHVEDPEHLAPITGASDVTGQTVWEWAEGKRPLDSHADALDDVLFMVNSQPSWKRDGEEFRARVRAWTEPEAGTR